MHFTAITAMVLKILLISLFSSFCCCSLRIDLSPEIVFGHDTGKFSSEFIPINQLYALQRRITLSNNLNILYSGNVSIGTPKQYFKLLFHTGASACWVTSSQCKTKACQNKRKYDRSKSKTFHANSTKFTIEYSDDQVTTGQIAKDNVGIDDIAVTGFLFGAASSVSNAFERKPFDGVCGLGFSTISVLHNPTLLDAMYHQGKIKNYMFSMYLKHDRVVTSKPKEGSFILFGDVDPKVFVAPIKYFDLTKAMYWQFSLRRIAIGAKRLGARVLASISVGSGIVYGPTSAIERIYHAINAKFNEALGYNTVPCSNVTKLPSIVFTIGQDTFPLDGFDYIVTYNSGSTTHCLVPILSWESSDWLLGDIFVEKYYTVFDAGNKRIGFANAKP